MHDNCHVDPIQKDSTDEERESANVITLTVWGMGCPNCSMRVRNGLIGQTGVVDADVDHILGMAQVTFDPRIVTVTALIEAVARAGNDGHHEYRATPFIYA